MSIASKTIAGLSTTFISVGLAVAGEQTNLDGRWTATLNQNGVQIPFRLDISGSGDKVTGTLYNGRDPKTTTSGSFKDGKLELNFEHYLNSIKATLKDGELDGQLISSRKRVSLGGQDYEGKQKGQASEETPNPGVPFHATRYQAEPTAAVNVPKINGVWEVAQDSPKGEKAWRLIIDQDGAELLATVLRIDGDTGGLTGRWKDGKFVASHFDGARPGLIEITPQADGSLNVVLTAPPRVATLTAYRPEVARAKGLPEPSNFLTHTTVRDPNELFAFSFPDTNGKVVTNEDYKGKVVVAVVTGTWCPNCHDEAQYLVQLYAKYHAKGLEILALDFEEPDQQASLTRVKAFIKKYGVPYPYLIAGAPAEMWDKVPQAVNLNTWPATFFIGKDGRVKAIHSGFAAPASGIYHQQLKEEFTSTIERLLKEKPVQSNNDAKAVKVASR